ncbi:uncharacterized protein LOC108434524 [Pygocentrus nattereri]|uniref:uncharacterized protein LOC108434524 n=1 Tax=Pygocentrus nattereri TaxID=42514 RepID=UPI00189175A1|nr:uncharacterized protein LOC108434524 [Pygocentrus nattereri]
MRMLVIGIVMMFTGASMGLLSMNPVCRFTQSDPCYGAVGRPLYLQLPSEYELVLKMSNSGTSFVLIFKFKNQITSKHHSDYPRWEFATDNRTMIISNAKKRDSGKYTLETFDSFGGSKGAYFLQLIIEGLSVNPVCRFTQSDPCYGAVGRPLYLQLEYEDEFILKMSNSGTFSILILKYKNQRATKHHSDYPRWEFVTDNRTMVISNAEKRDSGKYKLESFDLFGGSKGMYFLQLIIEDTIVQTNYEAEKPKDTFGVLVVVQVLEIIILLTLLGGFHIYTKIQRKRISRTVETTEQEGQESLYTNTDQEDREHHHRQRR